MLLSCCWSIYGEKVQVILLCLWYIMVCWNSIQSTSNFTVPNFVYFFNKVLVHALCSPYLILFGLAHLTIYTQQIHTTLQWAWNILWEKHKRKQQLNSSSFALRLKCNRWKNTQTIAGICTAHNSKLRMHNEFVVKSLNVWMCVWWPTL